MTESMIERMAIKMAELVTPPGENPDSRMFEMLQLARAAVQELRRPTSYMIEAGAKHHGGMLPLGYNAMIDAALQWPPGSADRAGVPMAEE